MQMWFENACLKKTLCLSEKHIRFKLVLSRLRHNVLLGNTRCRNHRALINPNRFEPLPEYY